jgi:hypothetical protein
MWEMGGMELCDERKQKRNHDSQQRVDEIHNQGAVLMLFYTVPSSQSL